MFEHQFKITKVLVLRRKSGTDKIYFTLEAPSPFPEMEAQEPGNYPAHLIIDVRRGYAEEWLEKMEIPQDNIEVRAVDC